jgi:NADH-quinone oxidoreductase subunit D
MSEREPAFQLIEESPPEEGAARRTFYLAMGPSHPAMHGIIRINLELDGERVLGASIDIGFLHRAFEKHCEAGSWNQPMPYTDRLNYVSPFINNFGYCAAVEKVLGIEVTERCQWVRTLLCEVSRVTDHLTCVGASAMELGAFTAFLYLMKAREWFYELVEAVTGARVMATYGRVGGVHADLPATFDRQARKAVRKTRKVLDEVDTLLTQNRIFQDRTMGVGVISLEEAKGYGFTGPLLRSCGLPYDVRKAQPYFAYDRMDFAVPCRTEGDNYARYLIRMAETEQSMRIVEQCLDGMPEGGVNVDAAGREVDLDGLPDVTPADLVDLAKQGSTELIRNLKLRPSPNLAGTQAGRHGGVNVARKDVVLPPKEESMGNIEGLMNHFKLVMLDHGIRPPRGEAYFPVEGANGELGFYVVSDGSDRPYRVRCRPPCFPLMAGFHRMIEGGMIADIIATFGTVNMIGGELDR